MFYDSVEDLINIGMLNEDGLEDELIGYTCDECMNCGRIRVEIYKSGKKICEKCDYDQDLKNFTHDKYYSNMPY